MGKENDDQRTQECEGRNNLPRRMLAGPSHGLNYTPVEATALFSQQNNQLRKDRITFGGV